MVKDRNETELIKVSGDATNFLAGFTEQDHSLDGMAEYRILPRFKIIQPTSDQTMKKQFGEGSAVIRPGDAVVWKEGDGPFEFVPQFFWVEFCKWSDLSDKENKMIMEITYDPLSDIAKRAKDPKNRIEVYPGQENKADKDQMKFRYVEHLRFCGIIYGEHELAGTPVVMSFERGEFFTGTNFISSIQMRKHKVTVDGVEKKVNIPLWAQVWNFTVGFREPDQARKWYGFDITPADNPVIDEKDADECFNSYKELKELHEKNRLRVDDEAESETTVASTEY